MTDTDLLAASRHIESCVCKVNGRVMRHGRAYHMIQSDMLDNS